MVISDSGVIPGFDFIRQYPHTTRTFESKEYPRVRLTVVMANHLPLEQQTGADLIYYNQTFRSFVMVQYKAMEKGTNGPEFRWRPQDKLAEEIGRMEELLDTLKALPLDPAAQSFRLHANPFFLKLCPRLDFNPDAKGLSKGMYLPLDYWKCLAKDVATQGPQGGRFITYDNVGRKISNSEFVVLVANAWVGTTVPQSVILETVIRSVIQTGKTVTFAIKSEHQYDASDVAFESKSLDEFEL